MSDDRNKKIRIELDALTFWKAGTIIFAVLFVIALLTGGFGLGGEKGSAAVADGKDGPAPAPAAPGPAAPAPVVDVEIGDAYFKGDADADVVIIEYSDFQCPFCARFYTDTWPSIQEEYIDTGKAVLAFKNLPLSFHTQAQKASEAAECAGEVGGSDMFWAMHDKIFENQQAIGIPDLKGYAGDIGVDQDKFDSCLDNGDMEEKVNAHNAEAGKFGASGTPTFFINGKKLVGAQPFAAFKAVIDAEL